MAKSATARARAKRELIHLAYSCATDPLQWPLFLREYTQAVGAEGSGLVVQDVANQHGSVHESWGFDPAWERKYADHYAATNIWMQRMGSQLQPGEVRGSESAIGDSELMTTEFYNDFLRPQGFFHSFGAAVTRENDVMAYITSVRSRNAGSFNAAEHDICREVIPHLQSALRLRHVLAGLEEQLRRLSAALDHLAPGIVIADPAGRILFMNRSAESTLAARNGLWIAADGLRAARSEDTQRLRRLLREAASTIAGNGALAGNTAGAGGVMRLPRPGKPPLTVSILPLAACAYASPRLPAAIVLIAVPPEPGSAPDPRLLTQIFGFTPAEARLASALAGGKSVKEFAGQAGVTLNTARSHLKNVFLKAGVSRQAALVREVLARVEQLRRCEYIGL